MLMLLAVFVLITNLYANADNEFSSFAEQDTVRLNQTVVSTPPVAVVEGFKMFFMNKESQEVENNSVKCVWNLLMLLPLKK